MLLPYVVIRENGRKMKMSNSIQRAMTNLTQLVRLHDYSEGIVELDRLGAIDMYYLEAINQLDNPTIGTISNLLGQSTPNTNYHIKKLLSLELVEKKIDPDDRRVTHLSVTSKYRDALNKNNDFWEDLQFRLEEEVLPKDFATFKRVLRQATEIIAEKNPR